jgi:ATP synthase protein I
MQGNNLLRSIRNLAYSYIYIQASIVLCISGVLFFLGKCNLSFSFLWGGFTCVLPNAYFAYKLFRRTGAKTSRQIVTSFYLGEVVKFILTVILFTIAFKFFNVNKLALFIGYIVAQIAFWFTALFRHQPVNKS